MRQMANVMGWNHLGLSLAIFTFGLKVVDFLSACIIVRVLLRFKYLTNHFISRCNQKAYRVNLLLNCFQLHLICIYIENI